MDLLALTKLQGGIIAAGGAVLLVVTALMLRQGPRPSRPERGPDIPRAMRPGPSDADLETTLFVRLQGWGLLFVAFFVMWIPLVWLREPSVNLAQEKVLKTDAIARGSKAVLPFGEENASGVGCSRCHGISLTGGLNLYNGSVVQVPNLTTVCGGASTGHPLITSTQDIYTTIQQGRNDMPSWSIRYAGALDDQQIQDIVLYLISIQKVPYKDNVCINPDAAKAASATPAPSPSASGSGK